MREDDVPLRCAVPPSTKTCRRKRRLQRGIHIWDLDRRLCAEPTRRVARLTLTLEDDDFEAAFGRVRDFWRKVRQQWLGTRYFCWLELTARGRVHYHGVWLNPPHLKRVDLLAWVARAWGSRTQVRFTPVARGGLQAELDYALGYAKKLGRKSYQQRYDQVPRELRTFMSQRTEIPVPKLAEHIDRDVWRYVPESVDQGVQQPAYLLFVEHLEHQLGYTQRCTALDWRRPKRRPRWDRAGPGVGELGRRLQLSAPSTAAREMKEPSVK